jgi:hypothetical protein
MNKAQSKSRATQRAVVRDDSEKTEPPFVVVGFRPGTNNQGKRCIYRSVRPFWTITGADKYAMAQAFIHRHCQYNIVHEELMVSRHGDPYLHEEWEKQRKGINRDADWRFAATYMHREVVNKKALAKEEMKG